MLELDPAQRWILALPAILNERNGDRHDLLGGAARPTGTDKAAYILAKGWDVHAPSDVTDSLEWLDKEGHRLEFSRAGGGSVESFLGWDYGRMAAVAGWAYVAYLIDLDQAWGYLRRAAAVLRPAFGSFAELGQSYLRGLSLWSDGAETTTVKEAQEALAKLVSRDGSPYLSVPWRLDEADLQAAEAPRVAVREVLVKPGGSVATAIEEAGPGGRVLLARGTFRESLEPAHSVEIVGEHMSDCVIEGDGTKPAIWVASKVSVSVQGCTVRSGRTAEGKGLNAIHVAGGYAHVLECRVEGSHDAVFARDHGNLFVRESDVLAEGRCAIEADPGSAIVLDSEIHGAGLHGIALLSGPRQSVVRGCHVAGVAHAGIFVKAPTRIFDTRVEAPGEVGIAVQGLLHIDETIVTDSKGWGIVLQGEGHIHATRVDVEGSKGANLDVIKGEGDFTTCTMSRGLSSGVILQKEANVIFADVTIEDNAMGNVFVMDDARVVMFNCTIKGGGAGGLWSRGSSGRYMSVTVEGSRTTGVELLGEGAPVLVDVKIRGGASDGVIFQKGTKARLTRCVVEDNEGAAVLVREGAYPVFEDWLPGENGEPSAWEGEIPKVMQPMDMGPIELDPIEEKDGRYVFRFKSHPMVDYAFETRGKTPPFPTLANVFIEHNENAMGDELAGVEMFISGDTFVAQTKDRELAERFRGNIATLIQFQARLRGIADLVELRQDIGHMDPPTVK